MGQRLDDAVAPVWAPDEDLFDPGPRFLLDLVTHLWGRARALLPLGALAMVVVALVVARALG